jgi:(2Fe-2S) ferredoxin
VQASDAAEIVVAHLTNGKPVERLMYRWPTA